MEQLSSRTSKRISKPTDKAKHSYDKGVKKLFSLFTLFSLVCSSTISKMSKLSPISNAQRAVLHTERLNILHDGSINKIHEVYASMTGTDNGVYTLKEMVKQDDRAEFISVMLTEVQDHESRAHWTLMSRNSMPEEAKTIMSIWSFKMKRFSDGRIMKHKARLCARGGMQTWGENY